MDKPVSYCTINAAYINSHYVTHVMLKMLFNPYIVSSFSTKDLGAENIYVGIDLIESG